MPEEHQLRHVGNLYEAVSLEQIKDYILYDQRLFFTTSMIQNFAILTHTHTQTRTYPHQDIQAQLLGYKIHPLHILSFPAHGHNSHPL